MNIIILILILGISFAQILLFKVDMWQAQGLFATILTLTLLLGNIRKNIPLVCFCSWVYIIAFFRLYIWMAKQNHIALYNMIGLQEISTQQIPFLFTIVINGLKEIIEMSSIVNITVILILYTIFIKYLDKKWIERILNYMRYVIILTMVLCVLQKFNLSQIFALVDTKSNWHNNIVTGLIGNGTHLSGFLGMCLPLFLWKISRENILAIILMFLTLLFCGTTLDDPSISGYIIIFIVFLNFYKTAKWIIPFILIFLVLSLSMGHFIPHQFFNDNGRIEAMQMFWHELFLKFPLTGQGLGFFQSWVTGADNIIIQKMRHVHFEPFQIIIETGIIGFTFFIWMIQDFFGKISKDKTQLVLKSIILGYLVSGCFNYPFHLWLPSIWALFCYSSFLILYKESEKNETKTI